MDKLENLLIILFLLLLPSSIVLLPSFKNLYILSECVVIKEQICDLFLILE